MYSLVILLGVVDSTVVCEHTKVRFQMRSCRYKSFLYHSCLQVLGQLERYETVIKQSIISRRPKLELTGFHCSKDSDYVTISGGFKWRRTYGSVVQYFLNIPTPSKFIYFTVPVA